MEKFHDILYNNSTENLQEERRRGKNLTANKLSHCLFWQSLTYESQTAVEYWGTYTVSQHMLTTGQKQSQKSEVLWVEFKFQFNSIFLIYATPPEWQHPVDAPAEHFLTSFLWIQKHRRFLSLWVIH